ncbi:MAG: hypothetical protein WD249_06370 [Gaiellaceae bacterium]
MMPASFEELLREGRRTPTRLERILAGDEAEQQALFRDAERLARSRGLGEVIDGWEPDVPFLRGDPSIEG